MTFDQTFHSSFHAFLRKAAFIAVLIFSGSSQAQFTKGPYGLPGAEASTEHNLTSQFFETMDQFGRLKAHQELRSERFLAIAPFCLQNWNAIKNQFYSELEKLDDRSHLTSKLLLDALTEYTRLPRALQLSSVPTQAYCSRRFEKDQLMQDQSALQEFSIRTSQALSQEMKDYDVLTKAFRAKMAIAIDKNFRANKKCKKILVIQSAMDEMLMKSIVTKKDGVETISGYRLSVDLLRSLSENFGKIHRSAEENFSTVKSQMDLCTIMNAAKKK